ncbi:MAG: hypothetical protein JXJ04_17150 [Spirochaetales bacterium]|nr:hypothetical protein [Spirochaetales bacterium]
MKRITLILLLVLSVSLSVCADDSKKMMSIDIGTGLSLPFFSSEALEDIWGTTGESYDVLTMLLLTKIVLFVDARYLITPDLSAGVEAGAYLLMLSDPAAYDFPLRVLFRYGGSGTFIELFGGYYISTAEKLSGPEVGARASLGGLYVDFSYVIAEYSYYSMGLGFALNTIFGF